MINGFFVNKCRNIADSIQMCERNLHNYRKEEHLFAPVIASDVSKLFCLKKTKNN